MVVIHQKAAGTLVKDELIKKYRDTLPTGKLVTRDTAQQFARRRCQRLRHADVPLADRDRLQPRSGEDRRPTATPNCSEWVKKNPKQFGYNGIKGGMSGVAFVTGWVSAFGGDAGQAREGPLRRRHQGRLGTRRMADLKEFNKNVVITPGNAGTLDMLNRGEIAMGPVWVDMFYTWKAEGKLPPNMRLKLVAPGMPGQPMYYAVPAKTGQAKLAAEFIALATSPEVQAEGIVKRFNWYPGIDAKNVAEQARQGGLEEALRRHHARGPGRRTASRSRSGRTSTTSSKPTRRRSRTDRLANDIPAGGSHPARPPAFQPLPAGSDHST